MSFLSVRQWSAGLIQHTVTSDSAIVYTINYAATFRAMMMMMRRNCRLFLRRPFSAFSSFGTDGKNETSRKKQGVASLRDCSLGALFFSPGLSES